jgi:hypothetical protein
MKPIIFIMAILLSPAVSLAQGPPPHPPREGHGHGDKPDREELEAQFIAYVTNELSLTPDESKAFWPVYNQFQEEMKTLRKERRESMKSAKEDGEITDDEAEKLIQKQFEFKQKELDLEKKYHTEFKKVLPVKKVAKLYRTEEQFKRKLLDKMRD